MTGVRLANHPKPTGFTLIELMVTVAVIGILAAIAYPSYRNSIVKSNRAAAQSYLMEIAQRQQQHLLDNRTYASTVNDLNLSPPEKVAGLYTVTIDLVAGPPPGFTVTARPLPDKAQANDVTLTINNAGAKTPPGNW